MQHPKTRGGATRSDTKPRTVGPKVVDQRWQRAPTTDQKKRAGKGAELETQLARLQEELKKTKDQLSESESCRKLAYQEAEEAKNQLAAMSAKLHDSQQQLDDLWACEESRIQELRKISQDRDRAWESELQAVQKHLTTAVNENQKLNLRLQKVAESEAAHDEVLKLKLELEEVKIELNESKESELRALEELKTVKLNLRNDEDSEVERSTAARVEAELRRVKVQAEQWRKAAEMAAGMVLGGDGEKFVDSSEAEEIEDESSMKKTSNMLKKIGVLLKKGQK